MGEPENCCWDCFFKSGQPHRRPTFSLEVESNEETIDEVRVAQSEEVEAKAARNFHR